MGGGNFQAQLTPAPHPSVTWAQRSSTTDPARNYVYLTISAPDVSKYSLNLSLKPDSLTFTGHSDTKKVTYHVSLEFYGEIDVENSKTNHTSRDVEFVLRKKELKEEYWPRLLKEGKKAHFLKTDFEKVRATFIILFLFLFLFFFPYRKLWERTLMCGLWCG